MKIGETILSTTGACLLVIVIVAVLAAAEWKRFEPAEYSSLYKSTLEGAFSRFAKSDKHVSARSSPELGLASELDGKNAPPGKSSIVKPASTKIIKKKSPAAASTRTEMAQGNSFAAKKQYDQALVMFQKCVAKNPESYAAFHRIGDILQAQNKLDDSIAAYRNALKYNPGYYCCYGHIGDIQVKQGKKEEAEKNYARLVAGYKKQAGQVEPQGALAEYQLASFYIRHNRNLQEALSLAEDAAKKHPGQLTYLVLLVSAYEVTGHKKEALETLDKVLKLKLEPNSRSYYEKVRARLIQQSKAIKSPQGK